MHKGDDFEGLEGEVCASGAATAQSTGHGQQSGERRIRLESISKIEGHGSVDIKISSGKVKYVKLKITESKRFYTQAIRNKAAISLPLMTSRICGTCSIAHLTCCSAAVEDAVGYVPSGQTLLLRQLSLNGMMIRDHALHLYLFCLPDLFGKDSVLDFEGPQEEIVRKAFAVKGAGNNLSKAIAGRAVHATFAEVGRFSHIPGAEEVKKAIADLKSVRDYAIEFIEMFYGSGFKQEHDTDFVALVNKDYSFHDGELGDSSGTRIKRGRYFDYLDKVVIPYSEATAYEFEGREYMVGALSRMNLNKGGLHRQTRADASKFLGAFPSKNVYSNNLAQAIEILHCIDSSLELLESHEFREESAAPVNIIEGEGVGVLEAPRGTLYYRLSINREGKTTYGSIIVPTQQNQISMERSIAEMVGSNIGKDRKFLEYEIEKLIRAYDPCMSCASHFLRINWK